jgi:hypothetical protein
MWRYLIFIYEVLDQALFISEQGLFNAVTFKVRIFSAYFAGFPIQVAVVAVPSPLMYAICPDGLQFITTF